MRNAADSRLVHRFVYGLRFACQPQYRVVNGRGRHSWADLLFPWLGPSSGDDGAQGCLLQAAVVMARKRPWQLAGPVPALSDQLGLAAWCEQPGLETRASIEEVRQNALGATVSEAIRRGSACGVQLQTDAGLRWLFVSGVEIDGADRNQSARALLLIDPDESPPWGAGYNARIELKRHTTRGQGDQDKALCVYRTVHGRRDLMRPKALLVVETSGLELPLYSSHQL